MSDQWYYAKGNEKFGPVSQPALRELAEAGKLLPTDKVWQKGMTEWQDASAVTALFSKDDPPPLPSDGSNSTGGLKQVAWNYICELWPNKLRFFSICLLLSVGLTIFALCVAFLLFIMGIDHYVVLAPFWFFVLIDVLLLPVVAVFLFPYIQKLAHRDSRRILLCGTAARTTSSIRTALPITIGADNKHWQPLNATVPSLILFADGGFLRSDGFGAKWAYDAEADAITVTPIGSGNTISLPIVSLTSHELVLSVDGNALHYKKGQTITGETLAEMRAKQAEFAKNAALVAVSAVAVVGIAAVGVLAAAGAAAAAAGAAGAGGGEGGRGGYSGSGPVTGSGDKGLVRCSSCGGSGVNRYYAPGKEGREISTSICGPCSGKGWKKA